MPRGKPKINSENIDKKELTHEEVFDVFKFAQGLAGVYQNVFTPDLVNSRLKDVNMNPQEANEDNVNKALINPVESENQLVAFSQFFEYTNMLYKRMLYYLGNMLSFDINYVCINADYKDYNTTAYKKDEAIVDDFFDKFNIKNELKKVTRQMVRQESFYGVFRNTGDKYVFQELPREFCKITGRSEYGYLFDMNMYWFMQPGVSLNMYPPYFKELYNRVFNGKSQFYNPANSILNRNGEYTYWVQTSQENDCWCFKFNQDQAGQVPMLSPLFYDVVLTPHIRQLQKNKYMLQAFKMVFGLVPMLKDNKSGNVKDMMALDSTTIGKFLGLIQSSLSSVVRLTAAPFEDAKVIDFDVSDQNVLQDHNKNLSASSGINARLLYANDKMSADETRNSISVDSFMMTYLYGQFEDFLNYYINKLTKEYKFKIKLEGTEFDMDRKTRMENAVQLSNIGIVLPHKFASALGMMPKDLIRQLEMAKSSGFSDKLMPMLNIFNQSSNQNNDKGGRPQTDNPTDSTIATHDTGSNISRGGDV